MQDENENENGRKDILFHCLLFSNTTTPSVAAYEEKEREERERGTE